MRSLIFDLKKVPIFFYLISISGCIVFIMLSTAYFGDNSKDNLSMIMYMLNGDNSLSALVIWHNTLSMCEMNSWLLILMPLICSLPYAYSFHIEIYSKYYMFSLNKQGLYKFTISRFVASGIYSAITIFFAMIITFVVALFYSGNFGDYSSAPICEMLIGKQSDILACFEICTTYMCFAFLIGIVCVTFTVCIGNSFTSCSCVTFILFMAADMESSYQGKFLKELVNGNVTYEEYNHFIDFLFVGNLSHGMPEFENNFSMPYIAMIGAYLLVILLFYTVFHIVMKKKVIL